MSKNRRLKGSEASAGYKRVELPRGGNPITKPVESATDVFDHAAALCGPLHESLRKDMHEIKLNPDENIRRAIGLLDGHSPSKESIKEGTDVLMLLEMAHEDLYAAVPAMETALRSLATLNGPGKPSDGVLDTPVVLADMLMCYYGAKGDISRIFSLLDDGNKSLAYYVLCALDLPKQWPQDMKEAVSEYLLKTICARGNTEELWLLFPAATAVVELTKDHERANLAIETIAKLHDRLENDHSEPAQSLLEEIEKWVHFKAFFTC